MPLLKRVIRKLPGMPALDGYLRRRYVTAERAEGHPTGHYYSAVPNFVEVRSKAKSLFRKDVDPGASLQLNVEGQFALLKELVKYYADFHWTDNRSPNARFFLNNDFFTHGDAIVLSGLLRHLNPGRVIEIGSGFSSALMLDTRDRFLNGQPRYTFIEPRPERLLSLLRPEDEENCTVMCQQVQDLPTSRFQELGPNDILFIDSSHVSKVGSDVNFLVFEVLPSLRSGVYIHFHDIFWPFEYPVDWIVDKHWAWNEAYLVRAFLHFNSEFEIVMFNSFVAMKFEDFLRDHMPLFLKDPGGSLWLRRK
jgi:hypothetical protein